MGSLGVRDIIVAMPMPCTLRVLVVVMWWMLCILKGLLTESDHASNTQRNTDVAAFGREEVRGYWV